MKKLNVKQISREIDFPYHTLLRISNKYNCTTKEELLEAIKLNKKFKIGDKYGKLTIISDESYLKDSHTYVKVQCECGTKYDVPLSDLKNGRRKACSACRAVTRRIPINLNDKFGDWTVISEAKKDIRKNSVVYLCQCTCGNTQYCNAHDLTTGRTSRCFKCSRNIGIETMMVNYGKIGELNIGKYNKIKKSAEARNIEFDVSIEYLWNLFIKQNKTCAITGIPITDFRNDSSLDRIDSSKGYIEGNVQWVTKQANVSKHIMSMEELYKFCENVLNNANQQPSTPLTKCEGSETNS